MKFIFLFFLFFSFTANVDAQQEFNTKTINIPPLNKAINTEKSPNSAAIPKSNPFAAPINQPGLFDKTAVKSVSKFEIGKKKEVDMSAQEVFVNPNEDLLDKLNRVGNGEVTESFKLVRGNQDLGNFKLKSKFVNIKYRDFGEVDGDKIRVYLNGKIVIPSVTLDSYYQSLKIDLEDGFNKIDFEALNQGTSGPNTAEFQVYDDLGKQVSSNQWNLATGFKASIMVLKE